MVAEASDFAGAVEGRRPRTAVDCGIGQDTEPLEYETFVDSCAVCSDRVGVSELY